MRTTRLLATVAAATAALLLAGCSSGSGGSSSSGGAAGAGYDKNATIQVGSIYEPQNLDNTAGGGQGVTEALYGNVYESLFKLGDDGKVTPLLATSYSTSSDGLTYTFKLRTGVKFHSGATMTSADVKYSIEKVLAPASQSARKSDLQVIKSIATPDANSVEVTLSQRSISFVYNLSYVWIIDHTATNLKTSEDGTGPYKLDAWKQGSTLSLTRFAGYWGTPATNKEVVFNYYKDATAENNALQSGQLDVVTSEQSPDALTQFDNNPSFKVNNGNSTTKLLLAFNDKVKPFNNTAVRVAITEAIDRPALLKSIWGTYGKVTGSMVPPTDPWYENLSSVYPYDPSKAKTALTQAGYPNGFSFTLDTPNYDPHPAAAQFIKAQLAKIGVTVKINIITPDEWYTKVYQNHDFTATMQEHVNDRDVVWYGNPDFYWGYNNPQVTKLINAAEQSTTTAEQTAKLKQANEQIVKDAASDWLYLYPQIVVATTKISGYPLNGLNSQFYVYDIKKQS
ncbi:ABC transporter substrate-binding protein [Gryllotalpicola reticulitermitis]|uniref:ABC transporter substrate-binding protein n=1 Tax=Gryllotalpicola reticulitermitis TaxID=1184153 RepID=A0ABV8Q7J8_9MICO